MFSSTDKYGGELTSGIEVRDVFWSACLEAWEGSTEVAVGEAESAERRLSTDGRISSGLSGLSLNDGACMPPPNDMGSKRGCTRNAKALIPTAACSDSMAESSHRSTRA